MRPLALLILAGALGLVLIPDRSAATPNEAIIPLDDVAGVYVKEQDGSFTSYIVGAPEFVNREFTSRYILSAPTPGPSPAPPMSRADCTDEHRQAQLAVVRSDEGGIVPFPMCVFPCSEMRGTGMQCIPTPTPTPPPAVGFTLSSRKSGDFPITEARGQLVCTASVSIERSDDGSPFSVILIGWSAPTEIQLPRGGGVVRRPAGEKWVTLAQQRFDREWRGRTWAREWDAQLFGAHEDERFGSGEYSFHPPYTLRVVIEVEGSWTVSCQPESP